MTDRERLLKILYERKDLLRDDCGFLVYWPTGNYGCFTAEMLRYVAEEIDRVNGDYEWPPL